MPLSIPLDNGIFFAIPWMELAKMINFECLFDEEAELVEVLECDASTTSNSTKRILCNMHFQLCLRGNTLVEATEQ